MKQFTPARVALRRAGNSVATRELLEFQLAHALARDAVHEPLDVWSLESELRAQGWQTLPLKSAAADRQTYLRRPDLGRKLSTPLVTATAPCDLAIIIADGLSALAVHRQALPLTEALIPMFLGARWQIGPVVVVEQGRVAIGDEIGLALGAKLSVMLIGERPGLSAPDSLGAYLTWEPRLGRTEAERNCISNIRAEGLPPAAAAGRIFALATEARRLQITGFTLKEQSRDRVMGENAQRPRKDLS